MPRFDLHREQSSQLQIQNGPVEPLPRASTVRAPTRTRRSTTTGQGLGEDLENVIKVEPVGNQMVHCLLALEGGDAGGASHELPNNGALRHAVTDLIATSATRRAEWSAESCRSGRAAWE